MSDIMPAAGAVSPSRPDEAALELVKQLITLASGVLALSAAFLEKFRTSFVLLFVALALSWLCLVVSVFFGLETISAIVKSRLDPDHDWSSGYGRLAARIAKYSFVGGLGLFALFAFTVFVTTPKSETEARSIRNIQYISQGVVASSIPDQASAKPRCETAPVSPKNPSKCRGSE